MSRCDRCGADSDVTFTLAIGPDTFTFDSFECALEAHDAIEAGKHQIRLEPTLESTMPSRLAKPRQRVQVGFRSSKPMDAGLHVRP